MLAGELTDFVNRELPICEKLVGKQFVGDDVIHCAKFGWRPNAHKTRT
jgi:hypothetical protein